MNNIVLMTNYVIGRMRRIYFMSFPETKKDYKKSRVCYTVGECAAQTIVQLAGGTFLATLMTSLGFSDGNIGVIASFGSFAALAQLISMKLTAKLKKNKLFVCLSVFQKIWFAFIYFIPLMDLGDRNKRMLMIVCYFFAQLSIQVGAPATIDWIATLVPARLRGRYFSIKDSIAVFVTITVMLVMGILIDAVKTVNLDYGFIILGSMTGILTLINVIAFSCMKEPKLSYVNERGQELHGNLVSKHKKTIQKERPVSILQETKEALFNPNFRKALILNCLWMTAFYGASPFNASYQIKELGLPYTFIMVLSFVMNMLRIYLTPKAGKAADRMGMSKVLRWSFIAMGFHYFFMAISIPQNAYVTATVGALFSSLGWIFIGIGMLGIQLEYLDEKKRIIQYALLSMISGVYGFLISFICGRLIDALQQLKLVVGGITFYAQQVTNIWGVFFVILTIGYLYFKIEKGK